MLYHDSIFMHCSAEIKLQQMKLIWWEKLQFLFYILLKKLQFLINVSVAFNVCGCRPCLNAIHKPLSPGG